jgi:hypothetical protein
MPRALTAAQVAALSAGVLRPALFVEGLFDSGTIRLWSGMGPIMIDGVQWTGAGHVLAISGFEEGMALEANGISITLSGMPGDLVSLVISEPLQNRRMNIYMAMFDDSGLMIGPLIKLFCGRADVPSIEDSAETCTITITVENRLRDLMRARGRRYEDADQQSVYPGDLGFQYVTSIQDKKIKWGSS